MKKTWRGLALLLIVLMIFSACGKSEQVNQPQNETEKETASAIVETQVPETEEVFEEDSILIDVMFWTLTTLPKDEVMVEEAINEITRKKINVEIDLNIMEAGNYAQQVNLIMAGGEKIDLMVTLPGGSAHFNSMSAQNQLTDLTDLLPEYAPELLEQVPDGWLGATTVNGRIYSVPSLGDKVNALYFICRKDIVEKTGIDVSTIKNAYDLEKLLAKAKEVAPELVPVAAKKTVLGIPYMIDENGDFVKYDGLGDGDNAIIGIMDGEGDTIVNNYTRPEYLSTIKLFKDWYDKGYIYADAVTFEDVAKALIPMNKAFGFFGQIGSGQEATENAYCQHEMEFILLDGEPILNTSKLRQFTWAVPSTSEEPEAAVKLLNLMYSDPEVINLIMWGIEGVHYQTLEDGTIDFMNGEDKDTCGYYLGDGTPIWGNGFLAKVRAGQPTNLREVARAANEAAIVSNYVGFTFSTGDLENEVAAITATIEESRAALACGFYTEADYNAFIEKLNAVGAEKYLDEIQKQLDAWLATK